MSHSFHSGQPPAAGHSTPGESPAGALAGQMETYLNSAPTSEFHGRQPRVTRQWQGRDNLLWHVTVADQAAVVKLFLDAGQARGRRQFDGQSIFAPMGIAPLPLWFDRYPRGLARQILVYEWLDGITLDESLSDRADSTPWSQLAIPVAELIAAVHRGPLESVRRFCPHPVNLDFFWRVEADALDRARYDTAALGARQLQSCLADLNQCAAQLVTDGSPLWQAVPPTPVHGDFTPENCLVRPAGTLGLVDWEQYGLGDPALDVARFCFHMSPHIDAATLDNFVQLYGERVEQPGLAARIDIYRRILPLQALTYLVNGVHTASRRLDSGQSAFDEQLPDIMRVIEAALGRAAEALGLDNVGSLESQSIQEWAHRVMAHPGRSS